MYDVKYHKPASLNQALELLDKSEDGAFLGGGQTLIPTMKQRLAAPSDLISIAELSDLLGIEQMGERVVIGAGVTHSDVAFSSIVKELIPALSLLASGIGDPQVRNMGTLGGSVANNDPAADYPSAVLALDAIIQTNKREIAAVDFFNGMFITALDEGEVIVSISFARPERAFYAKLDNPASRYALVGVFVAQMKDGSARVAITGAGEDGVFRCEAMEASLTENFDAAALSDISIDRRNMLSDIHGSAAYRAHVVKIMARRAVVAAV